MTQRPPVAELFVLGSGSKGNAFALVHDGAVLLLEAGYSLRELDRRMAAAGVNKTGECSGIKMREQQFRHAARSEA